jgi:hypothetical protein
VFVGLGAIATADTAGTLAAGALRLAAAGRALALRRRLTDLLRRARPRRGAR